MTHNGLLLPARYTTLADLFLTPSVEQLSRYDAVTWSAANVQSFPLAQSANQFSENIIGVGQYRIDYGTFSSDLGYLSREIALLGLKIGQLFGIV